MQVLVTGGCGYVGSVLVPKLLSAGHDVTVVDAMWFGNYLQPHPALTVVKGDIRNACPMGGVNAVIHLASVANDPCCDLDARLAWEVNCLGTQRLAEIAVRCGVRQFIYASSGSVYGVSDALQVTEDAPLDPISDYNRTKMVSERVVLSYANDMVVQIIRPATVCGISPRMRLDTVVNLLTMQALDNGVMRVFGGAQIRPNIHIKDMAGVYLHLLEHPDCTGIFNAGWQNLSVKEIASEIASRFVVPVTLAASIDPRSYRLNSDRLLSTGFRPQFRVADAVKEIIAAYFGGLLGNAPHHYNLSWMQKMGITA